MAIRTGNSCGRGTRPGSGSFPELEGGAGEPRRVGRSREPLSGRRGSSSHLAPGGSRALAVCRLSRTRPYSRSKPTGSALRLKRFDVDFERGRERGGNIDPLPPGRPLLATKPTSPAGGRAWGPTGGSPAGSWAHAQQSRRRVAGQGPVTPLENQELGHGGKVICPGLHSWHLAALGRGAEPPPAP